MKIKTIYSNIVALDSYKSVLERMIHNLKSFEQISDIITGSPQRVLNLKIEFCYFIYNNKETINTTSNIYIEASFSKKECLHKYKIKHFYKKIEVYTDTYFNLNDDENCRLFLSRVKEVLKEYQTYVKEYMIENYVGYSDMISIKDAILKSNNVGDLNNKNKELFDAINNLVFTINNNNL